jgi:polyferredoxin
MAHVPPWRNRQLANRLLKIAITIALSALLIAAWAQQIG